MQNTSISLAELCRQTQPVTEAGNGTFLRGCLNFTGDLEILQDRFGDSDAVCSFLRYRPAREAQLMAYVSGRYSLVTAAAGGWELRPEESGADIYWIPVPPMLRSLDRQGHILKFQRPQVLSLSVSEDRLQICFEVPSGLALDLVVWRIPADEPDLAESLQQLNPLERQRYFLWSSHTNYQRPSDVYLHLVYGHVYENHEVWPNYWRVCSELDAYALYVALNGLLCATGKRLYELMRTQVVFSVISRQSEDGGWYHGEWTDEMESHFRLHAGAMHMLAAYFEETRDPLVRAALERAAGFAAKWTDTLEVGKWYLHDSLENDRGGLKLYPFRHVASRALGKSPSNLLVLNTHLDTNIAMERVRRVCGCDEHAALIGSALECARAVVALRPAEWLYRVIYRAIGLTLLPVKSARALPLHKKAIKRIAWKYLVPELPRVKALFPRLVMPGGFIERGLGQYGLAVRYQPVNLMDLVRTRRLFDDSSFDCVVKENLSFIQRSGIRGRWKEQKGKEDDSLGFWTEALYHACLLYPDLQYRAWLAEAVLDTEDNGFGISPSLLGANAEAVAPQLQVPCPSPAESGLRVVNLSRGSAVELLVINTSDKPLAAEWEAAIPFEAVWERPEGTAGSYGAGVPEVPPRGWIRALAQPVDFATTGKGAAKLPTDQCPSQQAILSADVM